MVDESIPRLCAWLAREQGVVTSPEALKEPTRVVRELGALARAEAESAFVRYRSHRVIFDFSTPLLKIGMTMTDDIADRSLTTVASYDRQKAIVGG